MDVVREIELDAGADEVWEVVKDPDELAGWVGEEVREARFTVPGPAPRPDTRRLTWTWAPDGYESDVELTVTEAGPRTLVRVVERVSLPVASASSAAWGVADRWEHALLRVELWALRLALAMPA